MRKYVIAVALAALALAAGACTSSADRADERIRVLIQRVVESDTLSYGLDGEDVFAEQVEAFYTSRNFQPAWISGDGETERLSEVLAVFCRAGEEGLNAGDYAHAELERRIRRAVESGDSLHIQALAELDLTVTHSLMHYASDVLGGRVDPRSLDSAWKTPVRNVDVLDVIPDTTAEELLDVVRRRVRDRRPQYAALRDALARYRSISAQGGWGTVSGGPLGEGDEGPRVAALIARLAAVGDVDSSLIPADPDPARYSAEIAAGIERFQRRHGLAEDGAAGENVLERMNVSVDDRIRQLELNLERWRWLPEYLGSRYVYVNVPAFDLHAFSGGEEVLSMAVVVGEQYNDRATPVFSDTMEYVEFNPYWNVPEGIAAEEIVPPARDNPRYLAENDYEIVDGWEQNANVIDPDQAALDRVEDGTYRIRQKPGPKNALGQIKFMFPNDFDIYLHDTPEEHLFERAERAFSHGCIRLERPVTFGEFALGPDEWTESRIQERIDSGRHSTVSLDSTLPVYILYWTAFVDGDGLVNFREDIYGSDEELDTALETRRSANEGNSCDAMSALLGE